MERLPGIEGGQNRELLFGSVGFGIAALMTALLAVFVTTEIRSGVKIVLQRLGSMEGGLPAASQQMQGRPPLEEFDRVLHGIDSLALALQEKIENERTLESQVRHNERLSALGQFAAGIAHELRNPLGTIRMRTQMWQRSADPEAAKRSSAVILEEIDRLDTIISRLLYFARPIQLQLQPVSLDDLCEVTASTWADKEAAKGIQIICKASSHSVVTADRGRLLQVLDNLMENAVYSAAHSDRERWNRNNHARPLDAEFARIDIADDGPGCTRSSFASCDGPVLHHERHTEPDLAFPSHLRLCRPTEANCSSPTLQGRRSRRFSSDFHLNSNDRDTLRQGGTRGRTRCVKCSSWTTIITFGRRCENCYRMRDTRLESQRMLKKGSPCFRRRLPTLRSAIGRCRVEEESSFSRACRSEGLLTTMPVIILTAHGTGPNAMQAMQLGAYDFITKPLDIDLALATVARAIRHMELQREVEVLRHQQFRDNALEDLTDSEEGGEASAYRQLASMD